MTSYNKAYTCKNCGVVTMTSSGYCKDCSANLVADLRPTVARRIMQGESRGDIVANLEQDGIDSETAWQIIQSADDAVANDPVGVQSGDVRPTSTPEPANEGRNDIVWGLVWLVGGAVVSLVTYSAASGGGTYVMFWGAIGYGIFKILRGLTRL